MKCVALDAMGVIYQVRDDVKDLLYPFIVEKGGLDDFSGLWGNYFEASLGRISSEQFWKSQGIDPSLEDEYLARHRLSEGLREFLEESKSKGIELWCLSNDLAQWSLKLRRMHGLETYFSGFIISGDAGLRKPDPAIYRLLLTRARHAAGEILVVDDNISNLDAAKDLGLLTTLFNASFRGGTSGHPTINGFAELAVG
ncbi:MAG: HAD family hydrolase [Dehalococcoidia bacterium]